MKHFHCHAEKKKMLLLNTKVRCCLSSVIPCLLGGSVNYGSFFSIDIPLLSSQHPLHGVLRRFWCPVAHLQFAIILALTRMGKRASAQSMLNGGAQEY